VRHPPTHAPTYPLPSTALRHARHALHQYCIVDLPCVFISLLPLLFDHLRCVRGARVALLSVLCRVDHDRSMTMVMCCRAWRISERLRSATAGTEIVKTQSRFIETNVIKKEDLGLIVIMVHTEMDRTKEPGDSDKTAV
jgi:hypothetical protein